MMKTYFNKHVSIKFSKFNQKPEDSWCDIKNMSIKPKAIIVSGYFNPIHKGRIEYFNNVRVLPINNTPKSNGVKYCLAPNKLVSL